MCKRLNLLILFFLVSLCLSAQRTENDSIILPDVIINDGEIKLNINAIKQIDFGTIGEPLMSTDKPSLEYDETLPTTTNESEKTKFTLMPYTANTPFNYNPIYKVKIKVDKDTWKVNPYHHIANQLIYSNWAKNLRDGTQRTSLEQIEAAGVRQVMGMERRNNMNVPSYQIVPVNGNGLNLGGGKTLVTTAAGSTVGGFDFMKPFTKEFWDKSGRKRRERTLEVLKHYGDSTTIMWGEEIIK